MEQEVNQTMIRELVKLYSSPWRSVMEVGTPTFAAIVMASYNYYVAILLLLAALGVALTRRGMSVSIGMLSGTAVFLVTEPLLKRHFELWSVIILITIMGFVAYLPRTVATVYQKSEDSANAKTVE